VRNFQILIVSAVKFCKQCLQTASVSGVRISSPYPLYRAFALDLTGGLSIPHPVGYGPQMKIPGAAPLIAVMWSAIGFYEKTDLRPTYKLSIFVSDVG